RRSINLGSEYFPSLLLARFCPLEWTLGRRRNDRGDGRIGIMSTSNDDNPDLAALRGDLAILKRDVTGLIAHLKSGAANGAENAADRLDDGARRLYRNVVGEGERAARALGRRVEAQ